MAPLAYAKMIAKTLSLTEFKYGYRVQSKLDRIFRNLIWKFRQIHRSYHLYLKGKILFVVFH